MVAVLGARTHLLCRSHSTMHSCDSCCFFLERAQAQRAGNGNGAQTKLPPRLEKAARGLAKVHCVGLDSCDCHYNHIFTLHSPSKLTLTETQQHIFMTLFTIDLVH